MAVKGETDPAARAHIDPTSSRKPAVVEAGRGCEEDAPHLQQLLTNIHACVKWERKPKTPISLTIIFISNNVDYTGKCNLSHKLSGSGNTHHFF